LDVRLFYSDNINIRRKRKLRKLFTVALVLAVTFTWCLGAAFAGNCAHSGAHYNLNIIGVQKTKGVDMSNNGRRIFVGLGRDGETSQTKILLQEGPFKVIDANGTDDGQAIFQLPNPDPTNDGITEYSVFARALGKPYGTAKMTTCFYDTDGDSGDGLTQEYCSTGTDTLTLIRTKGKQSFQNVSRQLLYIYADIDADGQIERVPLFADGDDSYYWYYDNQGLKLAQLRFYEIPTDVND
jgi:hypothetical protein